MMCFWERIPAISLITPNDIQMTNELSVMNAQHKGTTSDADDWHFYGFLHFREM